jgi:chromosome segregation ATPase
MRYIKILLILIALSFCSVISKTIEQMQLLHKEIGNDLMSIRKEFTAVQPKIYSLLDRIDRMYNVAKTAVEKKRELKNELKNKVSENKKILTELNSLKIKLSETENALENSTKKFTSINKELELEKVQSAILSREKKELAQEKDDLQNQMTNINFVNEKNKYNKKDLIPENILKGLSEDEKDLLKTSQNLSLSSTSAPSSPR